MLSASEPGRRQAHFRASGDDSRQGGIVEGAVSDPLTDLTDVRSQVSELHKARVRKGMPESLVAALACEDTAVVLNGVRREPTVPARIRRA